MVEITVHCFQVYVFLFIFNLTETNVENLIDIEKLPLESLFKK